jgi:hypothetical protein
MDHATPRVLIAGMGFMGQMVARRLHAQRGREAGGVSGLSARYNIIVSDASKVQDAALPDRRPTPTVGLRGLRGLRGAATWALN